MPLETQTLNQISQLLNQAVQTNTPVKANTAGEVRLATGLFKGKTNHEGIIRSVVQAATREGKDADTLLNWSFAINQRNSLGREIAKDIRMASREIRQVSERYEAVTIRPQRITVVDRDEVTNEATGGEVDPEYAVHVPLAFVQALRPSPPPVPPRTYQEAPPIPPRTYREVPPVPPHRTPTPPLRTSSLDVDDFVGVDEVDEVLAEVARNRQA